MKRAQLGWLALLLVGATAWADQQAYVSAPEATRALQVLVANRSVHAFCAPCGDTLSQPVPVRDVSIGRVWEGSSARPYQDGQGQTFWEVYLNGEAIDLAYVYVRDGDRWENLALRLGLPASDVPRTLPVAQTGR